MKILRLLFLLLLFGGLANQLSAQTASVTEGCVPLSVTFTAPAGQTSFFWDFKDGATSVLQNPANTFTMPGVYVVEFKNSSTGPVIGTVEITVFAKPDLIVTASPNTGCPPIDVELQSSNVVDPNIVILGYSWVFGDGTGGSGAPTVVHNYTSTGSFDVSLALQTNHASCNVTELFDDLVVISEAPSASFSTDPNPAIECSAPFTVSFTNTSSGGTGDLTYSWDYGNGNTSTDAIPEAQTYLADGQYPVTLIVTDENDCSSSFTTVVSVGEPTASFVIADTVCVGSEVQLQNTSSAGQYVWDFGPNATPQGSTNPQPSVTFNTPGQHTISLTVTSADGMCSAQLSQTIVAEQLDINFTAVPDYSCATPFDVVFTPNIANADSYFWEFGDGTTSDEVNPTHNFANPDTTIYSINGELMFEVSLTISSNAGCTATFLDTILLRQPNALFEVDVAEGCGPLTVTFSDQSSSNENISSWEWIFGDGMSTTNANNSDVNHTYTTAGEYDAFLVIVNDAGCRDTSYALTIEVGSMLAPNFSIDQSDICPGDTVTFTDLTPNGDLIDAWHFSSDNDRTFHCYRQNALAWPFVSETGVFDVTLTVEYNGCYSSTTQANAITVSGPIADIDYLVECDAPYSVQFTDASQAATAVSWDFGDMNTSIMNDPFHTYADTGDYLVKLTAENAVSGCPASVDSLVVHIRDIKSAFELDTLLCLGQTYMLDATTSEGVEADCWRGYTWYFDSNRPITTQDSIIDFVFNQPGRDSLTLVVRDINGCTDTSGLEVRVYGVYPEVTADKDTICFPSTVTFTDNSMADTTIMSWEWDFGDGSMGNGQMQPPHVYNSSMGEPIMVTITVTDVIGCGGSVTLPIEVYRPVSFITASPPGICVGETIDFTATDFTDFGSNLSYSWDFGNNDMSTLQSPSSTYNTAGNYTVNLDFTEIATGCMGSTSVNVEVQDFPEAAFSSTLDDQPINCAPVNATFTDNSTSTVPLTQFWDFGNGQTGVGSNPATNYIAGTYTVTLTVSTSFGCTDMTTRSFTVIDGPVGNFTFQPTTDICRGESITFSLIDTSMVSSFSWDFGDGTIIDDQNPVTHPFQETGPRTVTLILRGLDDQCEVFIEQMVNIQNTAAAFEATDVCLGDVVNFVNNSSGADVYSWDFGDGTNSNDENPSHLYANPGSYLVTLSIQDAQTGCTDELTQTVNVLGDFTPEDYSAVACLGEDVVLPFEPPAGYNFTWSDTANLSCSNCPNPVLDTEGIQDSLVLTLNVFDAIGCGGGTATYTVFLPEIFVPDVFTPNADGINDFFNYVVRGEAEGLEVSKFQVFSRWGKLVYDNESPDKGWSGMYNDKMAPSDVYIYNIEVSTADCPIGKMNGDVTLIR